MKRVYLTIILSAVILTSPAQVKCNISKVYAYFTVTIGGAQMVDDNGNRVPPIPHVTRFIYLECNGIKKPSILSVNYNNISIPLTITKVESNTVTVGKKFEDEKEITISTKKGSTFWKIELQPPSEKKPEAEACKNIIIRLIAAKKICSYKVTGESQLYTPPMY